MALRVLPFSNIMQQLRESLPLPCRYRHIRFDRDAEFSSDVFEFLKASGIQPIRSSVRSPWQNGVAERWMGSVRRQMLDHVIPLNEQHLRRLGRDYLVCYRDRTHIGLEKTTPAGLAHRVTADPRRRPLSSVHLISSGLIVVTTFGSVPWPINRGTFALHLGGTQLEGVIANSPAVGLRPRG